MNALIALARSALKTASTVSAGELEARTGPNRGNRVGHAGLLIVIS